MRSTRQRGPHQGEQRITRQEEDANHPETTAPGIRQHAPEQEQELAEEDTESGSLVTARRQEAK